MSLAIGNPYLAEVELKKARDSGVAAESIKVDMSRALLMQGRADDAIKAATPENKESLTNRQRLLDMQSRALLMLGKIEESCARSKAAHDLQPETVLAAQTTARCAVMREKDFPLAENLLRTALAKDKDDPTTLSLLADVLRLRGQTEKAVESYRASIAKDPLELSTRSKLVSLFVSENRLDDAQKVILEGRRIANTPNLIYMQALVEFKQGKHAKSTETLTEFLKLNPKNMPAVFLSGANALHLNKLEQAAKDLGRYLAQYPDSAQARRLLASAQTRQGLPDQALETLKPLISGDKPDSVAMAQAGEAYLAQGKYSKAVDILKRATALDPKTGPARTLLAMSHFAAGDNSRALAEMATASQLEPNSTRADSMLVGYYMQRKEFDQALKTIAAMEKKLPNDPEAQNQRGLAFIGKKDYASARASFEKALVLKPGYFPAASGLARLDILQSKNYGAAQQRFEAVLEKDKNNVEAMIALARLAEIQQKDKDYEGWLKKASSLDKTPSSRLMLAEHYIRIKNPQGALTAARDALSVFPDSISALAMLGKAQIAAGEKENAIATFTKLIAKSPKVPNGYYTLGTLQAETKQWPAARQSLTKAFELLPNSFNAAEALAMLELSQGRATEASQVARRLQKAAPKSTAGFILEGDLLIHQGKVRDAVPLYEKAYSMDKSADSLMRLHSAQIKAGDAAGADKKVQAWLQINTKDTIVRQYLAATLAARGVYQEAARIYENVLALSPNNPFVTNDLAWVYSKMGDSRAQATAELAVKLHPSSSNALDTLGWILVEQKQLSKGIAILEQATSKKDASPGIHYHLAAAYSRSGDNAKARQLLEQLLKSKTPFPEQAEATALLGKIK